MLPVLIRAPGAYQWDRAARRFRDPSGRFVSQTRIKGLRNTIVREEKARMSGLFDELASGAISPDQFTRLARALLKRTNTMEYMLGRGGKEAMTASDYGRLGQRLRQEYKALNGLVQDYADGKVSEAAARNRASMYIDNTRAAYEAGQRSAWDVTVETMPPLHPRCQCSLNYQAHGTGDDRKVHVYWRTNSMEPCSACIAMREEYGPLIIDDPV